MNGTSTQQEAVVRALGRATCNICGRAAAFGAAHDLLLERVEAAAGDDARPEPNPREGVPCLQCGSISRDRCLVLALSALLGREGPLSRWEASPEVRVWEGSAYRGHPPLLARVFDYFAPDYDRRALAGRRIDGRRHADVEAMPYPGEFFDVVMSSDVLEHVRLHLVAIAEIHRTLRPGGLFLLQVPYVHEWQSTQIRVHPQGDSDVFLYPAEYHAEDTLVYRIYGRDLLTQLARAGFSVVHAVIQSEAHAISPQSIILCRKGSFLDITGLLRAAKGPPRPGAGP